jgi:acyl-CoA thioester hydrolase
LSTHLLPDYPVVIQLPVAWGEMDAFNHVNNIVYFRYFESARIAYFEKLDLMTFMEQTGIGPILASTHCRYKIPLTYPDTIAVGAKVSKLEADRFTMKYMVASKRHQKIAAEGDGVIVSYDYRMNEKVAMPAELTRRITALEGAGVLNHG